MNKTEKYSVIILKKSEDHIVVTETEDFTQADKEWRSLTDKWVESLKEQRPFELRKPIITAFDPGLIYEITLRPVQTATQNPDNPYYQEMKTKGFTNTFNQYSGKGVDILDSGYKV